MSVCSLSLVVPNNSGINRKDLVESVGFAISLYLVVKWHLRYSTRRN